MCAANAHAQTTVSPPAGGPSKPGAAFVYGGLLVTSIFHDTQDTGRGDLHYNYIGELDWPTTGALFGGGVSGRDDVSGLYRSRERLTSLVVRYDVSPRSRVSIQPLGGLTLSSATQTLTDQHGLSSYPGLPPYPISRPDTSVSTMKFGAMAGADVVVRAGGSVAVMASPRFHWIDRDKVSEYEHVVPYAGPVITAIAFGLQWRPHVRR